MFLIAITGGIACGKSSVADLFEKHDVAVISGDKIARQSKYYRTIYFIDLIFVSNVLKLNCQSRNHSQCLMINQTSLSVKSTIFEMAKRLVPASKDIPSIKN